MAMMREMLDNSFFCTRERLLAVLASQHCSSKKTVLILPCTAQRQQSFLVALQLKENGHNLAALHFEGSSFDLSALQLKGNSADKVALNFVALQLNTAELFGSTVVYRKQN